MSGGRTFACTPPSRIATSALRSPTLASLPEYLYHSNLELPSLIPIRSDIMEARLGTFPVAYMHKPIHAYSTTYPYL